MITADALLIRQRKLARLRLGGSPRALEICSGCGGLSLGLQTTASVVESIFLVIVMDGLFAIFFASIGM